MRGAHPRPICGAGPWCWAAGFLSFKFLPTRDRLNNHKYFTQGRAKPWVLHSMLVGCLKGASAGGNPLPLGAGRWPLALGLLLESLQEPTRDRFLDQGG